jgi:hypothetical protein
MKPVPGGFRPSLGWKIHGEVTLHVLPTTGTAGSRGRVIRGLNTAPFVCEMLKMGGICTK